MRRVGIAQAEVRRASRRQGDDPAVDAHLAHADERLDEAKADLGAIADEPPAVGWRERLVALPWKRISLVAAGLFVAAILAITAFELLAGESVSSITGGTDGDGGPTISRIGGGSDTSRDDKAPSDDTATPSGRAVERALGPGVTHGRADRRAHRVAVRVHHPVALAAGPTTPAPTLPVEPTTTPSAE